MIPALFAEEDDEPVEVGQVEEERFAVHIRISSGRDYFVISYNGPYEIRWDGAAHNQRMLGRLLLPRGEALEVMSAVRALYMTPGGGNYDKGYNDLRLVGERSGDVRDPELLR